MEWQHESWLMAWPAPPQVCYSQRAGFYFTLSTQTKGKPKEIDLPR